jgi:hypothetical protein
MADDVTTVTREVLYDQVWSMPMTKLAKEYGVSDVALRKTCRKEKIRFPSKVTGTSHPTVGRIAVRPCRPQKGGTASESLVRLPLVQPRTPTRSSRPVPRHWLRALPGSW